MAGPNTETGGKSAYNNVQVGGAPTQRISKRNSTGNASWRGPNTENFEKKFYRQCKLGRDRNKFCENNISVPIP